MLFKRRAEVFHIRESSKLRGFFLVVVAGGKQFTGISKPHFGKRLLWGFSKVLAKQLPKVYFADKACIGQLRNTQVVVFIACIQKLHTRLDDGGDGINGLPGGILQEFQNPVKKLH